MTNLAELLLHLITGGVLIICGSFMLGKSLERAAGERLIRLLKGASRNETGVFFVSAFITAAVQSSTAVTALTVSMAEGGILTLAASMAVVYGANIGTTVTAQMMSIGVTELWLPLALFGGALCLTRKKNAGNAIIALSLVFLGIKTLQLSADLIRESGYIMNFVTAYAENDLYCVFFGFISTALVHSSSATVGLTIAMFSGGVIGFRQAVAITLGDNIGTCVTALLASSWSGSAGRRVAWGHAVYNIICAVLTLAFMDGFLSAVRLVTELLGQSDAYLVANAHTLLNILGAALFMPLNRRFCAMLELMVREGSRLRPQRRCFR